LGEHGSCKSTLAILIVRLTDPRAPEQRSPPTKEEDLLVAAKTSHVLPYDNFSHLPDWLSDAFCRLATGGGAGKRKLYTDDDEILFEGRRPILLTGTRRDCPDWKSHRPVKCASLRQHADINNPAHIVGDRVQLAIAHDALCTKAPYCASGLDDDAEFQSGHFPCSFIHFDMQSLWAVPPPVAD
jgi:hypothetical protein